MTPGAYLRTRRQAAGLSIADVAAKLATEPRLAEHVRAEWVDLIEADAQPTTFTTVVALRQAFAFDFDVLVRLVLIDLGERLPPPNICRSCACSWPDGRPWLLEDPTLCTACVPADAASVAA